MAARVAFGTVVAGAVAVWLAWGFGAFSVYLFFAAIAGAVAVGARVGGDWLTAASRRRFDDDRRRR
ncbi:MAG: hypothetical protein H0X21_08070 [Actinobacteria bacterium]|nr:hypothetical protein [Actinomycetota bacterium]